MKNYDDYTYQTGRTQPPKSHQGVIALLLILVILLLGAVSALSLMNIHLFRMLKKEHSVSFSTSDVEAMSLGEPDGVDAGALGFTGQEFTPLYRSYQAWPQGIYISKIDPDSPAFHADLQIGDILVAVDDRAVSDRASFETALSHLKPGSRVTLTVFRQEQEMTVTLTLPKK